MIVLNFIYLQLIESLFQLKNMNTNLPMHKALTPLTWIIGKWVGENGIGEYPSIKPFKYCEEIEFKSNGQPLLNFYSRTWHAENKSPMHFESGFLRINPGTNEVALMSSHNFGMKFKIIFLHFNLIITDSS